MNRCSTCGIDYPVEIVECLVEQCRAPLSHFTTDEPQEDWRECVAAANAPPVDWTDKVPNWRFSELMKAGFAPRQAEILAAKPHHQVDLHEAQELAAKAGPALAYEILI